MRSDLLLVRTLLSSWRQQWQQILLVLFGLLSASAGLSSVLILNETARQKMSQVETPFIGTPNSIARLKDDRTFSKQQYANLLNLGANIVGLSRFTLTLQQHKTEVVALDSAALLTQFSLRRAQLYQSQQSEPQGLQTDKPSAPNLNTTTSDPASYENMDLSVWAKPMMSNQKLQWFYENDIEDRDWPFPAPVAMPQINDQQVYVSMMLAGTLTQPVNINEIWIFSSVNKEQSQLLKDAGFELHIMTSDTGTLTNSFYINITAMGLLMFTVSIFISLNAYHLLLSGRHKLIKQLYFVGVSIRHIKGLFALESNVLTLLCCGLGFLGGMILAETVSPGMQLTLKQLYDASFDNRDVSLTQVLLIVLGAGLVATNVVLLFPLNQYLQKLTHQSQHRFLQKPWIQKSLLPLSMTALLITILLQETTLKDSLISSFVLITLAVLLGCVIVLNLIPELLKTISRHINPDKPLRHYFSADAVRLSDKSKIAVCAFFIAITANIGMNLMVGSFRQATQVWIEQQFVADYYLSTKAPGELRLWADEQTDLDIYHRAKALTSYQGRKTEIIAMPEDPDIQMPLMFKHLMNKSQIYKSETDLYSTDIRSTDIQLHNIVINEQMSIRHKLAPGDVLTLQTMNSGNGVATNKSFRITGIYYDYGNMFNQILMQPSELALFNTDNSPYALFSVLLSDKHPQRIAQVEKHFAALEANFFSGNKIKDISMSVFEQTFVITSGLNLITLLVAGASLATSILIIEGQNTHQTRIIRQMGISSFRLWLGSLAQYSYLITVVFVLSLPFGILLSYQLINNINYAAFQWSYPLKHDVFSYGFVYITALATVLVAVSVPYFSRYVLFKAGSQRAYV